MASSPVICGISVCLLLVTLFSQTNLSLSTTTSPLHIEESVTDIHELLPKYGFPKGILPNNIKSYTLSEDGYFEIYLLSPCYVQFDQLVYYDKKITGKLTYGSVSNVSGIQTKKLFLWLSVTGIKADKDSGMIEFYVGSLSERLPANQFEQVPTCKAKACHGSESHPDSM
ncbi:hypothetical protein FEM48_Zijuj04G0006300 [Ziziphus jujuba var. spinosa]|nr:hypothetical protein FEM48_Zijuj04G0006300 [Ziziphus jujuba var. spinosa]